jgi:hypothetical protein
VQNASYDYSLSGNGTYLVSLIAQNECGPDTVVANVSIGCLLSSEVPGSVGILRVYPNPTTGVVRVEAPVLAGSGYALTVTDFRGKVVLSQNITAEQDRLEESLDLGGLSQGMYYLLLRGREGMWGVKIVVE